MFLSKSAHTVDAKGRVFVPKRFQEVLDRGAEGSLRVILTKGFEGCLFLFAESGFRKAALRLHTQAFSGEKLRRIQRLFFANTHKVQLDSSGRLLIPEELRRFAGLQREVMMIGSMERAEIWDKDAWTAFEEHSSAEFDELGSVLCGDGSAAVADGG